MKALVATVNHILLVDLNSAEVEIVESNRPEYYGISWWENVDSLVLSHSGLENDSLVTLESYVNSEKGYLSIGNVQTENFLSQPHQILCAPDNCVITSNTGRNCITLYDFKTGYHKDIRINEVRWDRLGKDISCGEHFNSVYLKNNRLYILAHRHKKSSHVLVYSYPNCVLLERYEINNRSGLHNIWIDDAGNMITCNSNAGELIEVKSNETIWATGSSHYVRGLAATTDVIIVGDSMIGSRSHRKNSPSDIWIIDRKNLQTLDYLPLGSFGAVHEIRILDVADDAHHGKVFSGLDKLKQTMQEKHELIATRRKAKIKQSHDWYTHRDVLKKFNCVINGWKINEGSWIAPKNDSLTLALTRETHNENFTLSLDYSFPESKNLSDQNISLVVGYRGNEDENMLAILVAYVKESDMAAAQFYINKDGEWKPQESLFPVLAKTGKLSLTRMGNELTISCNNSGPITRKFEPAELAGAVGIRCIGSQFKNFSITSHYTLDEGIRKIVKTIWKKNENYSEKLN